MIISRRHRAAVAGGSLLLALMVFVALAFAASTSTNTFTNKTGAVVDDLHVRYNTPIDSATQQPMTFGNTDGVGTNTLKFSGGTVASDGSVQVTANGQANKTRISSWWWTVRGHPVGKIHHGCHPPDCTTP